MNMTYKREFHRIWVCYKPIFITSEISTFCPASFLHVGNWMISSYMPFQVKYMPQGPFCSTLLVELQPWALLVNVLGCSLVLMVEDSIVCRYLIKCFHNPLILHALFLVHGYFVVFYIICHFITTTSFINLC
jgi:hypothetical protein